MASSWRCCRCGEAHIKLDGDDPPAPRDREGGAGLRPRQRPSENLGAVICPDPRGPHGDGALLARHSQRGKGCHTAQSHSNSPHLPNAFDGFNIVQLSDLHVEMSEGAMERAIDLLAEARYDVAL